MELKQLFSTQDNELEIITDSFKINGYLNYRRDKRYL